MVDESWVCTGPPHASPPYPPPSPPSGGHTHNGGPAPARLLKQWGTIQCGPSFGAVGIYCEESG
eukprot:7712580-Pyramimonas_sp.AAC.1